jgi:methyl-accepting chemotaxis protein
MATSKISILITAQDKASKTIGGVSGALGGLEKAAKTAAVGIAGAAVGIGAGLAKLAIDAAPLEGIQGAFAGIAESAGKSSFEMLDALKQSSAGMIAQRDLMTSFNKAAQLVGEDFAVQLPEAMQYLSKVSAATGEDMDFMLNSLVTGVGRMSPMILDNLGIQVQLSEATARAADMFGVEASQLTKAQQQAGMMNVILQKLEENTANMPDVTGTAATSIGELKARMQDLKDQIGLALLPAIQPLLEVFIELAETKGPKIIEFFQQVSEVIQAASALLIGDKTGFVKSLLMLGVPLEQLETGMPRLFAAMDQFAASLGPGSGAEQSMLMLGDTIDKAGDPQLAESIERLGAALGLGTEDVSGWTLLAWAIEQIAMFIEDVNSGMEESADQIAWVTEKAAELVETFNQLKTLINEIGLGKTLAEVATGIGLEFGGGKQIGGPVAPNTPYMVGEGGPELFVPGQAGNIVPNTTVTVPVYLDGEMIANVVAPILGSQAKQMRRASVGGSL